MLLVAMLPYNALISRLVCAVSALEAVNNWEDWLGQRHVLWQWYIAKIILPLPLLEILCKLLLEFRSDLVFLV